MSIARLQKQVEPFGEFVDVDLAALAASNCKLTIAYSHATQLSFSITAPEHTTPIERLAFVRFWFEGDKLADGTTDQDADHPLFEGFVETVGPGGDSNKVSIVCFDPTYRAARETMFMSAAYVDAGEGIPADAIGAIPRVVYNAVDESDADYAASLGQNASIGFLLGGIIDICRVPLYRRNCVPGNSIGDGYVVDDLVGLTFVPQEKIVWESESVRASTERLQRYEPRCRLLWEPGTRLWRFRDITAAPEVTVTLNDPTIDFPVLTLELSPNLDKCFTAMSIYGPPTTSAELYTWIHPDFAPDGWTNTLLPIGSAIELELIGAHSIETYAAWQIIDATKRRSAQALPDWVSLRTSEFIWQNVKFPQFNLSWDAGNTWIGAAGCYLDFLNGVASFPTTVPFLTVEQQFGQTAQYIGQHYFPPNAAQLLWAPFEPSLLVRVPETGYQGTAYTVAGLQLEKRVYDEQLAIGYEYGQPVTSADRVAQMVALATSQLEKSQDISWIGGFQLDGIDFSWSRLNLCVSFAANDGSGGTTTTGWEAIKAYVTDVEYDFENMTTTVQFSSDRAEAAGEDPAQIKQRLGIRDLTQVSTQTNQFLWRTSMNWRGDTYQELAGVQSTFGFAYVDKLTGRTVYQD
ncbi:MAG TPA: hypothetical protein VGM98_04765 [Schlesneria sp.]|jgi:hypothetical protein